MYVSGLGGVQVDSNGQAYDDLTGIYLADSDYSQIEQSQYPVSGSSSPVGTPKAGTTAAPGLTSWLNTNAKTIGLVGAVGLVGLLMLKTMK